MRSTRDLSGRSRAARATPSVPYSILLRAGFAMRRRLRGIPVVSYTTFSPLPCTLRRVAVYSLWHFPSMPLLQHLSRVNHGTPCPAESGLSSPHRRSGAQRPVLSHAFAIGESSRSRGRTQRRNSNPPRRTQTRMGASREGSGFRVQLGRRNDRIPVVPMESKETS